MENDVNFRLRNIQPADPNCIGQSGRCYSALQVNDAKLEFVFNRIYIQNTNYWNADLSPNLSILPPHLSPLHNQMVNDPTIPKGMYIYFTQGLANYNILQTTCPPGNQKPANAVWVSETTGYFTSNYLNRDPMVHIRDLYSLHEYGYQCDANGDLNNWLTNHRHYYLDFAAGGMLHELLHQFFDAVNHCHSCGNHVMGGGSRSYLSKRNVDDIHKALACSGNMNWVVEQPSPPNNYHGAPVDYNFWDITTDVDIDYRVKVYRDIVVRSGNTLTVTCDLIMPENGSIIVEKGAKLIVDGGVVTTHSDKFWAGIQVHGDNGLDQNNPTHQGIIEIKNGSLIESARHAIMVRDVDVWNTFGGIVRAENSTFRNCFRDAEFMSYRSPSGIGNLSYFHQCTFELTGDYNSPDNPLSRVTIWDNSGIEFLGCAFIDNRPNSEHTFHVSHGNGIYSIDAGYYVGPYCDMAAPIQPCPAQYVRRGSFKRLNTAIKAEGAASIETVVVDQTDFEDNSMAMEIKSFDQVRFTRNNVKVGAFQKSDYIAVSKTTGLKGFRSIFSNGYEIEENVFEQNGPNASHGINIVNSEYQNNRTYRNDFRGLEIAQLASERNLDPFMPNIGLQFLCNTNSLANNFDIVVNDGTSSQNGGVRNRQGSKNKTAANIVSLNPTHAEGHFQNNSPNVVRYYHSSSTEEPTNYTAALVIPIEATQSNNCPVNYQTLGPHGVVEMPANAHQEYYQGLSQYHTLLYAYHQNIDNGNTDSLVQAINLTISAEAQDLRDQLMAEAPFVSNEALVSAAETGILPDALLLEICLANPEATTYEGFLDLVEFDIPNPLPASMVQLIYQNWETETPRTLIEDQLAVQSEEVEILSNQILRHYQTDTIPHEDSIISLHESRSRLASKYKLIELKLEQADWTACATLFAEIEQKIELADWQWAEHNNLKNYVNFRQTIAGEGISYMELNETQLASLRSIANLRTGRSSVMAQNILCFGYNECFLAETGGELRIKLRRVYDMTKTNPSGVLSNQSIVLQPNPVNDIMQLKLEGFDLAANTLNLQIYSIEGKLILEQAVSQATSLLNMRNFDNGVYLYRIYQNQKELQSGRIIVNH